MFQVSQYAAPGATEVNNQEIINYIFNKRELIIFIW